MNSDEKSAKRKNGNSVCFLDSYAVIEILDENPRYLPYASYVPVLTKLNLFEIFEACLRRWSAQTALRVMEDWSEYVHEYPLHIIPYAAEMRSKDKKRRLSMTDCIGYCMARHLGVPFLTGDKEFKNLSGVTFVT